MRFCKFAARRGPTSLEHQRRGRDPSLALGIVLGLTSVILVSLLGQPRIFRAMAHDGLLPPTAAKIHPRFQTPYVATIISGIAAALHQDNLLTCNAVLVYYGAAPKAWVDIKLRELLKTTGYGRQAPIAVQAVYIAPPDDRRKDRFHSHQAGVIRQPGEFQPRAELDAFVSQIRVVCA